MRPKRPPQLCETPDCEEPAGRLQLCDACYQWHWRMRQLTLKQQIAYRRKMARTQSRIEQSLTGRSNGRTDTKTRHRNNMPVSESSGIN